MAAATASRPSTQKSSPALRAFELNPFRILRLDGNVSTTDAANQAENALTLSTVGMELPEPDPLPWLPSAGPYDLQQAAQTMEEPLVRLKHQMMWFDCVRDPSAALLKEALQDPKSPALQRYLSETLELPVVEDAPAVVELHEYAAANSTAAAEAVSAMPAAGMPAQTLIDEEGVAASTSAKTDGKGADLSYDLQVDFWESIRGTEVTLNIKYKDECTVCSGSGLADGQKMACPSCRGMAKQRKICLRCGGSGELPVNCSSCRGRGQVGRPTAIKVKVPPGIQQGMRVRLAGKGEAAKDGAPPGDLYVKIEVAAHPFFRRNGDDVSIRAALSASEAADGVEIDVPATDGAIRLRIPKNTASGQELRLRGAGIANVSTKQRGDLYVEVAVEDSPSRLKQLRKELDDVVKQVGQDAFGPALQQRKAAPRVVRRQSTPAELAVIAQAMNQANLRLLIASASIDGMLRGAANLPVEPRVIAASQWKPMNGLMTLPAAHALLAGNVGGPDAVFDGKSYWEIALQRWTQILGHPCFRSYVEACIADLGDDYVSADDAETVEESMRTHLVDLSANEARLLLLEARYKVAGSLISAIAESGMETRVLTPATRPLRQIFQSELSELESLLEQCRDNGLAPVDAYLRRLEVIKARWLALDEKGIVRLRELIDDATEKAYLVLRNLEKPDKEVDRLLARAGNIASAQSLKERFASYQSELAEERKRLCHFCKTEKPDYEKSVVLKGKRESHRESSGNTTMIHYNIRYALVFRCVRCAKLHDFIRHTGLSVWLLGLPAGTILFFWIMSVMANL